MQRIVWPWLRRARSQDRSADASPETTANIRLFYWDIAWFGLLFGVSGNFLVVFVARLDPSPWLISVITSGPALINILWQLPAIRIADRMGDPRLTTVRSSLPQRFGYLLIALLPFVLPLNWQAYTIVAITLLQSFPTAIMVVAFQTMFTVLVPRQRMAEVVGMRNVFLGITSTIMAMLCGVILSVLPFPLGYQAIFLAGFLASLGSIWSVSRLHTGSLVIPAHHASQPRSQGFLRLRHDRNFVRFALGAGILHVGMFMTAPLFPLYWIGALHLSDSWISILASTLTLTSVIGAFGMRAVGQRMKLSLVMGLSSLLFAFYPILTSVMTNPWLLVAVTAFSGTWSGVINVALFSALAELCPPEKRSHYIGVYTWLMNIAVFAAPLLGAAFAEVSGVVVALVIAGIFRIIAAIIFWRFPFVSWDRHPTAVPATPA